MSFQPAPLSATDVQIIESKTWGKLSVAHVKAFVSAWNAGVGLDVLTQVIPARRGHLAKLVGTLRHMGVNVRLRSGGRPVGTQKNILTETQARVLEQVRKAFGPDGTGCVRGTAISARLGFKHSSGAAVVIKALIQKGRLVKHWSVVGVGACYGEPGSVPPPKPPPARVHTLTPEDFQWTPEIEAEAHRLYVIEGKSGAQAAREVGCSRCAMIGKAQRMGWAAQRSGDIARINNLWTAARSRNKPKATTRPKPVRPEAPKPEAGKLRCIPLVRDPLPLLELEKCQCRYPVSGDGEATMFCGVLAEEGQPYCPGHAAICFNGIPDRRMSKPYDPTVRSSRGYAA